MSFESLEQDPIGEVRKMYEALDLASFEPFEPILQGYVASLSGYQKNTFANLSADLKARIAQGWKICLDEWGYSKAGD